MNYMYSLFCIERFVVLHVGREKVFFFNICHFFSNFSFYDGTHKKIRYVLQCHMKDYQTKIKQIAHTCNLKKKMTMNCDSG